jgi:hypothetical protein
MSTVPNRGIAALRQTYRRVSRDLWKWCSQSGAPLILLLLLALALAVSYAFPQTPAHIRSDPKRYREWISAIQVEYRDWTSFLDAIGVFGVRDTAWFRILLALTAFVSLVSLGNRLGHLACAQTKQAASFYDGPDTTTWRSTVPPAATANRLARTMASLGLRTRADADGSTTYLWGYSPRWAMTSAALAPLGTLLFAVGLAVTARWGWDQQGVQLLPGEPYALGPEASHEVKLLSTSTSVDEAVIELDGQQALVSKEGAGCRGRLDCRLTDQSGHLVQVRAQRRDETPIRVAHYAVRPEPLDSLRFTFPGAALPNETDRLFLIPDEKLVVRIKWLGQDEQQTPGFYQWVFRQGGRELVGEEQIPIQDGRGRTQIGDITYDWRVSHYITLDFLYRPGRWASSVGIVFAVVGMLVQLIPQQVWSVIRPQDSQVVVQIRQQRDGMLGWRQRREDQWSALRAEIGDGQ